DAAASRWATNYACMSHGWTNLSDKLILRSLIYAQFRITLTANAKNNWPRGQMLSIWGVKFRQIFSFPNDRRPATLRPDMDHIIEAKEVQIERKHFYVEFRENDRGRFLRITEEAHGRRTKRKPAAKHKAAKCVYYFGEGKADGNGKMKPLLGGKGANLAEMTRIGLPVPPGFTISTEVCTYFYAHNRSYPRTMQAEVEEGIRGMERIMGTTFGDTKAMPLLVAVRSGARDSMPGMMDTILNLGLNDETVLAVAKATKNERFAWDCYRRFIQMYGDVVMGVQKRPEEDHEPFETVIHELKHERHHKDIDDTKLSVADLKEIVARFKKLVKERTGKQFPNDPWEQLHGSICAVFGSWMNDRAIVYRRKYNIPQEWGTAVNVQAMVFGNTGVNSGSGVAFT